MAMPIDRSVLDALRSKTDIVDLIGRFLPLEKKGKDYVTVCPFHDDHDPSMRINADRQIYKCFVCGAGGDVFTFFQKYEGLSFTESVQRVADLAGFPLQIETRSAPKQEDPRADLFETLQVFTAYCGYELFSADGKAALSYLESRRFDKAMLDTFQIGYAPARSMVEEFLQARIQQTSLLEQTGLIYPDSGGRIRPVFTDRIVIPIHDPLGNPVGYTARILPGSEQSAKYINSPTSELYDKSHLIFNYHRAVKAAKKSGRLILVEGAMDVLGLAKAGLMEGIACLGTAMTDAQLSLIARCNVPVTVFYDQDGAGRKAAYCFGLQALNAGIRFSVVKSDLAKDPDDIFITQGSEALITTVNKTVSFAEFCFDYLQSVFDLDNYEDKKSYARQMEHLIRTTLEPFEQKSWLDQLAEKTGFTFSAVRTRGKEKKSSVPLAGTIPLPARQPGRLQAEKSILWAMLYHQDYLELFKQQVGFFADPACAQLYAYINYAYQKNADIDPVALKEEIEEEDVQELLVELSEWPDYSDNIAGHFRDSLCKIKRDILSLQIETVLQQMQQSADPARKMQLAQQAAKLSAMKNQVLTERNSDLWPQK